MAKKKYKQKPQFWYCLQYDGENPAEMVAFCPEGCKYDPEANVLTFNLMTVEPTNWLLQDMAGVFSMMIDSQFKAFFQLDTGP
jgi:hypothetical protein